MASKEKELEDRLREVGNRLASPPSAVDELILLLDQTESILASVEQSPSQSMSNALKPVMTLLVARDFLEHPDLDVKTGVTSCISEITRITAPEAPYDDDLMKEIFERIVGAFEHLDDVSNPSFSKRVAILETVAKVRSCVVMLDLECDALILKMFQNFFKTIRAIKLKDLLLCSVKELDQFEQEIPDNSVVFSSMETIMSLVLEESEDISSELLKCLLENMKIDNHDILPVARKLGEKVINNCAEKLKPYLRELFKSKNLEDYNAVVFSLCQYSTDILEQNEMDVSGDIIADDSRQSEQTVSDELHKGSRSVEQEVDYAEKAIDEKLPEQSMSNGKNMANGNSAVEPSSPKQKSEHRRFGATLKKTTTIDENGDNVSNPVAKKVKGTPVSSSHSPKEEQGDQPLADTPFENDIESCSVNELKASVMTNNGTFKVPLSTEADNPDTVKRKRGCTSSKSFSKKDRNNGVHEHKLSSKLQKGIGADDKVLLSKTNNSKESFGIIDAEQKPLTHKADAPSPNSTFAAEVPADATSFSEDRSQKQSSIKTSGSMASQGASSQKQQKSSSKQRYKTKPEKDTDGKIPLKEMISSGKKTQKSQGNAEESAKGKPSSKRVRGAEQLKEVDGSLVGSSIKVWWPDDKKYYRGTVEAYDPSSKKHKVLYDDGDIETLLLKEERWVLLSTDCRKGQVEDNCGPDVSSEEPRSKRTKSSSNSVSKQSNVGAESETPKRKGRPPKGLILAQDGPSDSGKAIRKSGAKEGAGTKSSLAEDTPSDLGKAIEKSGTNKDAAASKSKTNKINGDAESTPRNSSKIKDDSGRGKGRKEVVRLKTKEDGQTAVPKLKISGSHPRRKGK